MKLSVAQEILRCYRPSGADESDREFREALALVKKNDAAEREFRGQVRFDNAVQPALAVPLDEPTRAELARLADRFKEKKPASRISFRDPAIVSVSFGLLALVVLGVWLLLGKLGGISGKDELADLAMKGNAFTAEQFEPVNTSVGKLGDWFLLKGFDGFAVPKSMTKFKTVGVRLFDYQSEIVAVAAVPQNRMLFYVFRGAPLSIGVAREGEWKTLEYAEKPARVLAIREDNGICFMATMEGTRAEMEEIIRKAESGQKQ